MLLIDLLWPITFVELGTFVGNSYCAFCQAVQKLGTGTRCHAIDRWTGDDQVGFYGPEILADLRAYHDPRYGSFSHLLQSSFEDATDRFADGSIDLLHIDGHHSYESVKDNFDSWLPKVSDRGVVLLHDTHEFKEGFGVHRFWKELENRYPATFAFGHGHGLGVVATGNSVPPELQSFFEATPDQADVLREFFHALGRRYTLEAQAQLAEQ